jgi:iron complex transport system ATP-binding protein
MVLMGTTSQVSNISSPGPKQRELVMASLERMGITHLFNRSYNFISGGERQLVLISRALAQQAKILVMDEPTANLDYGNQMRVLDQIKSLSKEGYTIILSTHNPDQSYLFADRILALNGGKLIADGTPKDIITTELIRTLYNVDITVESLHDDNIRFCVPNSLIK